jgi:7-cyano-7-deazaguanine reductase
MKTLEELYGLYRKEVGLKRVETESGKWLEVFPAPGKIIVTIEFPEFTCLCPRTGHPDFANITIKYIPKEWCVELKSWKYYLNSFRNEGHFHEEVVQMIEKDARGVLDPIKLTIIGDFNVRGGTHPVVAAGNELGILDEEG